MSYRLAILRIVTYGWIFWLYGTNSYLISYGELPPSLWLPNGIMRLLPPQILSPDILKFLEIAWKLSLGACIAGLFFKWTSWITAILSALLFGMVHSYGYFTHIYLPIALLLFILAGSRAADQLSADRWMKKNPTKGKSHYEWPIILVQLLFCLIFMSAAIAKLRLGGWQWATGDTLQNYVLRSYMLYGENHPWAASFSMNRWLANKAELCKILGFFTLILELSTPLALFSRRLRPVIIISLFVLQVGIYFTIFVNFQTYLALYFFWLPLEKVWRICPISSLCRR